MDNRLLETIDCAAEYGSDRYFQHGDVKIIDSPIGKYREAEAVPLSRFGYRFSIQNTGKPHEMVIRFPDDKRRFMCIVDGTCYDLSTGICTGFEQPLSSRMLEVRNIFWPRWEDCSITFMTWGHGEPAAVSSIEIYELDSLPAAEIEEHISHRREFGIQYEDPCGCGSSEGAMGKEEWIGRIISYARHTGQKLLSYPICWYHGPRFPSKREPSDDFECLVTRDRNQYGRWTTEPADWITPLLDRLHENGMEFRAVLTLLRLGSLMQKMNTDLDAIKAGADTINNMFASDEVQTGTCDWTPIYNARNYPKAVEYYEQEKKFDDFPWVYGEKKGPFHPGPIFNPLHPVVQEAIIGFAREIAELYGNHPAFKGIAFTMWAPTIIWFGSIHSGYDDYAIDLFEKETGIQVPIEKTDPNRFSKRYEFLAFKCPDAWTEWRCLKIRDLIRKIRDAMRAINPGLKIVINLWSEPLVFHLFGFGGVSSQLYARKSGLQTFREAGIDPGLYENEVGIEIDLEFDGGERDRTYSSEGPDVPLDKFTMFRDHDFLDIETLGSIKKLKTSGAFIFNAWHEAWGKHTWVSVKPDDPHIDEISVFDGKKAEGIFRMNSKYPEDGFWWDSQLRITPAFPAPPHFMEQYAHAVAELDALRITRGGLFLDKAHSDEIRKFAKEFRALPNEKFETIGNSTDPVAVRTLKKDGKRYLYAVNREYYPIEVKIMYNNQPNDVMKLDSYELRTFIVSENTSVTGFTSEAPKDIVNALIMEAKDALAAIEKTRLSGKTVIGMERMAREISAAIKEGRYALLRRALSSYIARKSGE